MIAFFILGLIGIAFYAIIAFGPEDAIKIMLVFMWAMMLLSAIISPFF